MRWAIFIGMSLILGGVFWGYGGYEIREDVPFYIKKMIGQTVAIDLGSRKIEAEIARTTAAKQRGLSFRKILASNHGMIFLYQNEAVFSFWMKDVNFSLDYIWVKDDVIVDLTKYVMPDPGPNYRQYQPKAPVNRVIEVNAGFIDSAGLVIGQRIKYSKDL